MQEPKAIEHADKTHFFSHYSSVKKAFLSSLLAIFFSTSLEMSQSDCGNCSQAGAFCSCWWMWAGEGAASWIPNGTSEFPGRDFSRVVCLRHALCQLDGKCKTSTITNPQCIVSLSPLDFLNSFWSHIENQIYPSLKLYMLMSLNNPTMLYVLAQMFFPCFQGTMQNCCMFSALARKWIS